MDDRVRNKLIEWNAEKLFDIFEEQEINKDSFECLNEKMICELIPKAGPRALFLKKWQAEFVNPNNSEINSNTFSENNSLNDSSLQNVFDEASTGGSIVVYMSNPSEPQNEEIPSIFDNMNVVINLCEPVNDIIKLLQSSIIGIAALNYYKVHRAFADTYRVFLVDVIVTTEMRSNYEFVISPERMTELAALIINTFPTELQATYYIPYSRCGKKKFLARGKLQGRYCHFRDILLASGVTPSCRGVKRKLTNNSKPACLTTTDKIFSTEVAAIDCDQKLEWLKTNIDPWETVKLFWNETSLYRIQQLVTDRTLSSAEYLSSVPALRHIKNGLESLSIDFCVHHPDKSTRLLDSYDNLEKQIIKSFENKKKKNADIKSLLILLKNNLNADEDTRSAVIFRLIPLILPKPTYITSSNGLWYIRKEEVQEYFLLHVKNEAELNVRLTERRAQLSKFGLTEQPFPVLIGEDLTTIIKRYVIINDIKYEAKSNIDCLDTAFKSFYALQLEFPKEASYPWKFLQSAIYKIESDDSNPVPALETFITDLHLSA